MKRLMVCAFMLFAWATATVPASAQEWQLLGERKVNLLADRDNIEVTRREGRFSALRLEVSDNDIILDSMRVVFENDEVMDLPVRLRIRKNTRTDAIDLPGRSRAIRRIELRYQANLLGLRQARVRVFGLQGREREPERIPPAADLGPDWKKLGTQRVDLDREKDVIELSRKDGRFDALIFRAVDSSIRFYSARVIFGNGERQDLDVKNRLRAGEDTEEFDLSGDLRFIDRIELTYEKARDRGGRGTIEAWGRTAEPAADRIDVSGQSDWKELGSQSVDLSRDKDTIKVGRSDTNYDAVLVKVDGAPVRFYDARIVFRDGKSADLPIKSRIRPGDNSQIFEFQGGDQSVDRIEFSYETDRNRGRRANVTVFGRAVEPPAESVDTAGYQWTKIGSQRVDLNREKDVIELSNKDGRFDAIVFKVSEAPVRFYSARVVFGNGRSADLPVRSRIRPGDNSNVFEFEGNSEGRFIDRIELNYEVARDRRGRAVVEVYGRKIEEPAAKVDVSSYEWEKLGTQRVDLNRDTDVIQLSRRDGRFEAVVFKVDDAPVRFYRASVVFGNGQKADLPVQQFVRPGDNTNVFEFEGRDGRFIDRIELSYEVARDRRGRAVVTAYGRKIEDPAPAVDTSSFEWEKLGAQRVDLNREKDVIELSRKDGRFEAIVLKVEDAPVRFYGASVVFGNGQKVDLPVQRLVRAGGNTDIYEFEGRGDGRFIDRIELTYEVARDRRGRAVVTAYGRKAEVPAPRINFSRGGWELLGTQRADRSRDTDVIQVGLSEGRFTALAVKVNRNDVRFSRVRVTYGNNARDDLDIAEVIREGNNSKVLTLTGDVRGIKTIALTYETVGRTGRGAEVEVWGQKVAAAAAPAPVFNARGYQKLTSVIVGRSKGRQVIQFTGGRGGPYKEVVVVAKRGDVQLNNVLVDHGNGLASGSGPQGLLREGEASTPYRLKYDNRRIQSISIFAETAGRSRVGSLEVYAR